MHPLIELRPALERAWSIETTWSPELWNERDPAWGQCGVTSLFLWLYFNHRLPKLISSKATMPDGSFTRHFWLLMDGVPVDLTFRQFPIGTVLTNDEVVYPDDIIENKWFMERYMNYHVRVLNEQARVTQR